MGIGCWQYTNTYVFLLAEGVFDFIRSTPNMFLRLDKHFICAQRTPALTSRTHAPSRLVHARTPGFPPAHPAMAIFTSPCFSGPQDVRPGGHLQGHEGPEGAEPPRSRRAGEVQSIDTKQLAFFARLTNHPALVLVHSQSERSLLYVCTFFVLLLLAVNIAADQVVASSFGYFRPHPAWAPHPNTHHDATGALASYLTLGFVHATAESFTFGPRNKTDVHTRSFCCCGSIRATTTRSKNS